MKTLKDQLLNAGLTDKQSVQNARKQHKQTKKPKSERGQSSNSAILADKARLDKTAADRELNRKRHVEAEIKAQLAQIKQLIQTSKLNREEAEIAYSFTFNGKIRKIYVSEAQQQQLSKDQISIVCPEHRTFELVPKVVANKIALRDPAYIIDIQDSKTEPDEDDPYAGYKIPDDLNW